MISTTRHSRTVLLMLAAGFGLASVLQARAQAVPAEENPQVPAAETAASDANDADVGNLELDWSQLHYFLNTMQKQCVS
jgi:hypothetical protein